MRIGVIFVFLFGIIILAPLFGLLTGIGRMDNMQMRELEGRNKEESLANFTRLVEDNLGFREYFLDLYSDITYDIFGMSGDEGSVIPGQEGFLFLGHGYNNTFYRHSGLLPLNESQMAQIRANLVSFFKKTNARGIPAVWAIAPDKATVYGSYYPKWVKKVTPTFDYSKLTFNGPKIVTADIRQKLEHMRDEIADKLYFKTNTHWNPLGAFFGYEAVMEAASKVLGKPLESVKLVGYKTETSNNGNHDLAKFLKRKLSETEVVLETRPPIRNNFLVTNFAAPNSEDGVCINDNALNSLTALIIHDSYYEYLISPYRQSFRTVINVQKNTLASGILQKILDDTIKIDIILVLIVERHVESVSAMIDRAMPAQ